MTVFKRVVAATAALCFAGFLSGPVQAQENEGLERLSRIVEAWRNSPHADLSAEAFAHWNEDGEIPGSCGTCHSGIGFNDYVSGPMQTPGILDHPTPLGNTVDCAACHGEAATMLAGVPFPSGVVVDTFGDSAMCAVCHQGRASTDRVVSATEGMEEDTVNAEIGFINVHYAHSAATQMGSVTRGGFQYEGKDYKGEFTHVPDFATCIDCHRPHSLASVPIENCVACHQGAEDFTSIRTTRIDIDGDGDMTEGIADPIATLHAQLLEAIQLYANEVAGTPVVYATGRFPYFFTDTNADGQVTEGEAAFPNRYQSWTPRLLKAAYNYQFVALDKASYVHNPHYAIQLLYDSLEDLSGQVEVDMAGLARP